MSLYIEENLQLKYTFAKLIAIPLTLFTFYSSEEYQLQEFIQEISNIRVYEDILFVCLIIPKISLLIFRQCPLPSPVRRLCKLLNEQHRYGPDGALKTLTFSSVICAKYTITPAFKTDYAPCLREFSLDIIISQLPWFIPRRAEA